MPIESIIVPCMVSVVRVGLTSSMPIEWIIAPCMVSFVRVGLTSSYPSTCICLTATSVHPCVCGA